MKKYFCIIFCFLIVTNCFADMSLSDIGVTSQESAPSAEDIKMQKTMDSRRKMLKTHEVLGLVTLGIMTATVATGGSGFSNDTHMYLGMASGLSYFTTAFFSLTAPKPDGITDRGSIKWHKRLAWVHFPAMLLAPVLGYMYKKDNEAGRDSNGLVKMHPAVAGIGYGAFALSAAIMTIDF